jgi:hypothetical protein
MKIDRLDEMVARNIGEALQYPALYLFIKNTGVSNPLLDTLSP